MAGELSLAGHSTILSGPQIGGYAREALTQLRIPSCAHAHLDDRPGYRRTHDAILVSPAPKLA